MTENSQPEAQIFTLAEANAKLPQVRRVLTRLQQLQQAMVDSQRECEALTASLAEGNGHSRRALQDQLDAGRAHQDQLIAEMDTALRELDACGALLKDPAVGLVDFYSRRAGELIFLCWRLGEAERIGFWHTLEGGFAGRQPVDSLIQ